MARDKDDLWRDFPKTAIEFERRFATEEACRAYWIEARWGGEPACARCGSKRVWAERGGFLFECADCDHQTSLTSGTLLEKTRKPFKVWFRAVFEISSRRNGISAKELQRILGFGSYKTAWSWLHKLRAGLVRPEREPLNQAVQIDEALVGGKRGGKSMVLVATETDGRVRLAHADNNDEATLKRFADEHVAAEAEVTTDGLASYNPRSLGDRPHEMSVQTPAERQQTRQLARRALDGVTPEALAARHACRRGQAKHLQAYLDEFTFRFNRRKTNGVGRIAARTIEQLVARPPLTMKMLIQETVPCRAFRS